MSLAKLTSISTKTLSLLLERQRLQTLPSFSNPLSDPPNGSPSNPLHLPQIKKNLAQLRSGISELERSGGGGDAVVLLKNQYERMRGMLGDDAAGIPTLDEDDSPTPRQGSPYSQSQTSVYATPASSYASPLAASPAPMPSIGITAQSAASKRDSAARFLSSTPASHTRSESDGVFAPYTDDPPAGTPPRIAGDDTADDTGILLQQQRFMMDEQDQRLDQLSHSITRQHHISVQINDELDVHRGLLEELDEGVDRTEGRLGTARRKLDRVAKGIKENSSVFAIGVLIFVLLILIIVLKT